ncbi:MAG: cysteine synthase A [Spirochaetia bacterium]|jgi:cysteine synthase A|nr:cysteine synthase A [Spirochaetia bacterium]
MQTAKSIVDLIGNTPLVELKLSTDRISDVRLLAKLEQANATGSVKARIAKAMIEGAEERGELKPGSVIIEATSGNTGVALSAIGVSKGYRTIIVMPSSMSEERRQLIAAYGAELVLTDGSLGMKGAIEKAQALSQEIPGSFIPSQFTNADNPKVHYRTTGPEIWKATEGKVDVLVAGVGTGGTLTGVATYLKEQNKDIKVIAVEPAGSPVLSEGHAGKHKIQGIGAGFVPEVLRTELIDEVLTVSDEEAAAGAKELAKSQQILAGISSGAAFAASRKVVGRQESQGKVIVVIFPDGGERYLSTGLFG